MKFFLIFLFLLSLSFTYGIPGGYKDVPVTDTDVVAAGKFAVETEYGTENQPIYEIAEAKQQVVVLI